jgi:hypothetical protein
MQKIKEIVLEVLNAIIPITLLITILQFTVIKLPFDIFIQFIIGIIMVGSGLIFFLLGAQVGILPMGEFIGAAMAKTGKLWLVLPFGLLLGFVITVADPDVQVLAIQVDMVSEGLISKNLLIIAVALGAAFFVGISLLRIVLNIPLHKLLIAGYSLVLILSVIAPSHFVPVSLDSGGVATGPLIVPFILALGVGLTSVLARKNSSPDSFGLIALACLGPILAVLLLGVIYY